MTNKTSKLVEATLTTLAAKATKATKNRHRKKLEGQRKNEFSREAWEQCKKHFNYSCAYCGHKPRVLSRDHFIPLSQGGTLTISNIIPCCQDCNNSKSNRKSHLWYKNTPFYSHEREHKILEYIKSFK